MECSQHKPGRIFLFTHARTASNLFLRMLAEDPHLEILDYAFFDAWCLGPQKQRQRGRVSSALQENRVQEARDETYQKAFDRLQSFIISAEQIARSLMSHYPIHGKTPVFKEHVYFVMDPNILAANLSQETRAKRKILDKPVVLDAETPSSSALPSCSANDPPSTGSILTTLSTVRSQFDHFLKRASLAWPFAPTTQPLPPNPTVLPSSFLQTMRPVCLYRHPARMFSSYLRVARDADSNLSIHDEDFEMSLSLRWIRLLYDWYAAQNQLPLVIEADDLINEESLMPRVCSHLGIDVAYLQTQWDTVSDEKRARQEKMFASYHGTLQNSTGVIKSQKRDFEIVLEEEMGEWVHEFGGEVAAALYSRVQDAMPDYFYLRSLRMR